MQSKKVIKLLLLVLLFSFLAETMLQYLIQTGKMSRLNDKTIEKQEFRDQVMNEKILSYLEKTDMSGRGKAAGLYLLESEYSYEKFRAPYSERTFYKLQNKWKQKKAFQKYITYCNAIWNDIKYFPVPESSSDKDLTVSFEDSWMNERTYGGKRGHEGTDIMASKNKRGLYPIISMTDGKVLSKGWLEKGGYRLLIQAPSGACFYYAHMDSYADIKEGQEVRAGDVLGFMGDTGYGKEEGTKGKFPVHLHVGIYLYPDGKEESINPYWILRFSEKHKLKCAYSM